MEEAQKFNFERLKKNLSVPFAYDKEFPIQLKIKELNTQFKDRIQPQRSFVFARNSRVRLELRLCLSQTFSSDGLWHEARGRKLGQDLFLELDDGDEGETNFTFFHSLNDNHVTLPEFFLHQIQSVIFGNNSSEDFSFSNPSSNKSKSKFLFTTNHLLVLSGLDFSVNFSMGQFYIGFSHVSSEPPRKGCNSTSYVIRGVTVHLM